MSKEKYLFGEHQFNRRRLKLLNELINPTSKSLLSTADIADNAYVCELAAGSGEMSCWMAKNIVPKAQMTAIDIDQNSVSIIANKAKKENINNINLLVMSAYDIGSLNEYFDALYHRFLLVHLTNPTAALKSMHSALKPSGLLICEVVIHSHCFSSPPNNSYDSFIKYIKQLFASEGKDYDIGKEITTLLNQVGYKLEYIHLHQPTLRTEHEKSMLSIGFKTAKDSFLQAGIASKEELDSVSKAFAMDIKKSDIWAFPNVCQVIARKV